MFQKKILGTYLYVIFPNFHTNKPYYLGHTKKFKLEV